MSSSRTLSRKFRTSFTCIKPRFDPSIILLYIAASVEQYCDITQMNALPENEGMVEACRSNLPAIRVSVIDSRSEGCGQGAEGSGRSRSRHPSTYRMSGGAVFPSIVIFFSGAEYWLADGFHRLITAAALTSSPRTSGMGRSRLKAVEQGFLPVL